MTKQPCTYILASGRYGTLYVGVTADLFARMHQHRSGRSKFTSRYAVYRLVYYEFLADMPSAIAREKQLKRWHRDWKINLLERGNPVWNDLAVALGLAPLPARMPRDGP
jgi:putative endonuclease